MKSPIAAPVRPHQTGLPRFAAEPFLNMKAQDVLMELVKQFRKVVRSASSAVPKELSRSDQIHGRNGGSEVVDTRIVLSWHTQSYQQCLWERRRQKPK
jgi:hypothetical protein